MGKILFIVESPGKVAKIQKMLGDNYIVIASVGHIRDLPPKEFGIDIENNFKPTYVDMNGKQDVINKIKAGINKTDKVILAADLDREGEMIAWSIADRFKIKDPIRVVYDAVTKDKILHAISNPRKMNMDLVYAQKGRRFLDRIIGYELSPLLWKVINAKSAGRVQSVVVRLIIDKENEIIDFFNAGSSSFFKINSMLSASSTKGIGLIKGELFNIDKKNDDGSFKGDKYIEENESKMRKIFEQIIKATLSVNKILETDSMRNPPAPLTTSKMMQDASNKLGFSAAMTRSASQRLYEMGLITYIRTDTTELSQDGIKNIGKYVIDNYGKNYHRPLSYKSKNSNVQEAHEAIRPTDVFVTDVEGMKGLSSSEARLYKLIWTTAVASQMKPAEYKVLTLQIEINKLNDKFFKSVFEKLIFPGYQRVYGKDIEQEGGGVDMDELSNIPKVGEKMILESLESNEEYKKPPTRYNEASLINKLDPKNLNIGRPSTYASIVDKIIEREYVKIADIEGEEKNVKMIKWEKKSNDISEESKTIMLGAEKNKFVPTPQGKIVTDFLIKNFAEIMDYKFTAQMEEDLDLIAEGKKDLVKVLKEFYKGFHPIVEKLKTSPVLKEKNLVKVGVHPKSGFIIFKTIGKHGGYLIMKNGEKEVGRSPIKYPFNYDNVTLEEAIKLFEFPKEIGKIGKTVIQIYPNKKGEGYYAKVGKEYVKLSTELKLDQITEEIVKDAHALKKSNVLAEFKDGTTLYTVLKGREYKGKSLGDYIKVSDTKSKRKKTFNIALPEGTDVKTLTVDTIKEMIENYFANKKNRFKKKDASTTTNIETKPEEVKQTGGKKQLIKKPVIKKAPVKKATKKN